MMDNYEVFSKKLTEQPVYFEYPFEEAVLRSIPNAGIFIKFKGKAEFKSKEGSEVVTDAILEHKEITKQQYDNF